MGATSFLKSWRSKPQSVLPATTPPPQSSTSIASSTLVPVPTPLPTERENQYGLLPLHIPSLETLSSTERQYPIDIIAIHGITGDAYTTWTSESKYFWLRDSLPKEFPGARIHSYGYPANLFFSLDTGDFESYGRTLLNGILRSRKSKEEQRRPILFICHSMGGIVVKKAINLCVTDAPRYSSILPCVDSILFLATPHEGSESADLISSLAQIANIPVVSRWIGRTRNDLIEALTRNSKPLFDISRAFKDQPGKIRIFSFIEQKITPPVKTRIVDEKTGSMNCLGEVIVDMHGCDHRTICRFESEKSQAYQEVLGILQERAEIVTTRIESEIQAADIPCLHSLAFPQMHDRLSSIPTPHPQTCTWLLTHPSFQIWTSSSSIPSSTSTNTNSNLLWFKGHPGTGKSTLVSFLRTHITTIPQPVLMINFFFYANGTTLQKSQLGMFRSLLHQLYTNNPSARKQMQAAYQAKVERFGECGRDWEWGVDELRHLFSDIVMQERRDDLIILIDALDEVADEGGVRAAEELIGYFHSLSEKASASGATATTKICISCRHYPVVAARKGLVIYVEEENALDLALWVDDHLSNGVEGWEREPEEVRRALEKAIVSKAARVFLWARLRVDQIIETLNNGACSFEDLRQLVDGESNELSSLYEGMLVNKIPAYLRSKSLHFMQWVCLVERPLSVQEMRYAMACDASYVDEEVSRCEESKGFVESDLRMEKLVKSLSGGLAEVRYHKYGSVIQPFHQTVTEYFSGPGLKVLAALSDPTLSSKSDDAIIGMSEDRLSISCLNYLSFNDVLQAASLEVKGIEEKLVFVQYATRYWLVHAERAERKGTKQDRIVQRFEALPKLFELWKLIHFQTDRWNSNRGLDMIHVASRHNLITIVRYLLTKGISIEEEDDYGFTPLHHAAQNGHMELTTMLLDHDANIEAKNRGQSTPLELAAENGYNAIVRLLLKKGAEVNEITGYTGSALQAAVKNGKLSLVRCLIKNGADVNAPAGFAGGAIQLAVHAGHQDIVSFLIDKDADLDAAGGVYGSVLQAAVMGKGLQAESMVRSLLDEGADVNVQGGEYGNALQAAAMKKYLVFVKLFLDEGADVNAQGGKFGTALQAACSNEVGGEEGEEIVPLLLSKGANVNICGGEYGTALQAAASCGDKRTVQVLLDSGADFNVEGGRFGCALQAAAASAGPEVVQLLLDNGARVDLKGGVYGNVLQAAAYAGNLDAAKLFLERGLDINEHCGEYGSALQAGVVSGKEDLVRFLLDNGASVNAQGGEYQNALRAAIFWNKESIFQLLLERGADPNIVARVDRVTYGPYGSPLHIAAAKGRLTMVKELLNYGADANLSCDWAGNALGAAISHEQKPVVEYLLERGADPNILDEMYGSPFLVVEGNAAMSTILKKSKISKSRNRTAIVLKEVDADREKIVAVAE